MFQIIIITKERMCTKMGTGTKFNNACVTTFSIPSKKRKRVSVHLSKRTVRKTLPVYRYDEHLDILEEMAQKALKAVE